MCNCINELSEKIQTKLNVDNGMVDFELLSGKTYTNFRYRNDKGKETNDKKCQECRGKEEEVKGKRGGLIFYFFRINC